MRVLLALFLAATAAFAAQAAPSSGLTLTATAVMKADPSFTASPDFSLAASVEGRFLVIWRLSDGAQVAQFSLPFDPGRPAKRQTFTIDDLVQDGQRLLLGRESWDLNKAGKQDQTVDSVFLVDVAHHSIKLLWTGRARCRYAVATDAGCYSIPTRAYFLGDGKRVAVLSGAYGALGTSRYPFEVQGLIVDLSGKIQRRRAGRGAGVMTAEGNDMPPVMDGDEGFLLTAGSDKPGRVVVPVQGLSGCELRDFETGRRLSSLERCTSTDKLFFTQSGLAEASDADAYGRIHDYGVRAWDTGSGAVAYSTSSIRFDAVRAARADVAYLSDGPLILALDRRMGRVLGWAPPEIELDHLTAVSPDGRFVLGSTYDNNAVVLEASWKAAPPAAVAAEPEVNVDEQPAAKTKVDPDAYAVVIGVEKYRQEGIPSVDFAARDARTMYAYLTKAMGYDPRNVILLTNDQATRTDFLKYLGTWLKNRVDAKSRVFIYYAGHGSPNPATGEGYLMPYEADPAYLEDTAFPIARLYSDLGKLPTKDVTVVLDSCFSGEGGRSLIAKGTRPLVQVKQPAGPANAVVLTAAGGTQISASDPERRHGLLTEYLLEGLHGAADKAGDGRITGRELFAYVKPAVERAARLQNVEQTPTLSGTPDSRPWIELEKPAAR